MYQLGEDIPTPVAVQSQVMTFIQNNYQTILLGIACFYVGYKVGVKKEVTLTKIKNKIDSIKTSIKEAPGKAKAFVKDSLHKAVEKLPNPTRTYVLNKASKKAKAKFFRAQIKKIKHRLAKIEKKYPLGNAPKTVEIAWNDGMDFIAEYKRDLKKVLK